MAERYDNEGVSKLIGALPLSSSRQNAIDETTAQAIQVELEKRGSSIPEEIRKNTKLLLDFILETLETVPENPNYKVVSRDELLGMLGLSAILASGITIEQLGNETLNREALAEALIDQLNTISIKDIEDLKEK